MEYCSQGWHENKHDAMPWLNYFWGALIRSYKEFEDRVGTMGNGKGSKTDQVKKAVARRMNPFAISDLESECPSVSRDMIRNVLRQLRDEGLIIAQGKGRSAKWKKKE